MDKHLKILTLGGLSIQLDGEPVTGFISRKVEALLIYLVANPREHPREVLGELLWDDLPQAKTMSYLRTALSSLQKQLAPFLIVSRQSLAFNTDKSDYWLDIQDLEPTLDLAETQWEQRGSYSQPMIKQLEDALQHYNGHFLDGFHIRNSRGFEGWMVLMQERLRNRVMEAFFHLGNCGLQRGNYSSGITHTHRALELDPLWEEAHRQLMHLYIQAGQRTSALSQFEVCKQILDEELGVEPEEETEELYQRILEGKITLSPIPATPNNLPSVSTPFINRPDDIQQIAHQLDQSKCRLLTLIGAGGIGKTRLAIEATSNLLEDYPQGIYFVPFASVSNPNLIAKTIAGVLDIEFRGNRPPEAQLIAYLHDKEMLLILDNLEHLITGTEVLSRILEGTDYVKLLVTSRERLNLAEEWLYNIESLSIPANNDDDPNQFASVQLFVQYAQRIQPDFNLEIHQNAVVRICQLVRGLPLALELAASWVRTLTCDNIVAEIERSIDFLTTSLRNAPQRHRSIRAVFESSWKLLTETEQKLFAELSVFRGRFNLIAAQAVTDVSIFEISILVDKSLLFYIDEYYVMHDLLRQFAKDKLAEDTNHLQTIYQRHSHYYAQFLEDRRKRLSKNIPREEYADVLATYENIIAAWEFAVNTLDEALIDRFLRPMFHLVSLQNDYANGEELFSYVIQQLEANPDQDLNRVQTKSLLYKAIFAEFQSKHDYANTLITKLLPALAQHEAFWEQQLGLRALGNTEFAKSNYFVAKIYFEQARAVLENTDDATDLAEVLFRLSDIEAVTGDYQSAKRILEQSEYILANAHGRQHMRYLLTLGDLSYKLGELSDAEQHFDQALNMSEDFDARRTMAIALVSLGRVSHAEGDYETAREFYEKSINNYQNMRNQWGKAFALIHLGKAWHADEEYTRALHYFRQALVIAEHLGSRGLQASALRQKSKSEYEIGNESECRQNIYDALELATSIQAFPLVLDTLIGIARLKAFNNQLDESYQLAQYIAQNPISDYEAKENANTLIHQLHSDHNFQSNDNFDTSTFDLGEIVEAELKAYRQSI